MIAALLLLLVVVTRAQVIRISFDAASMRLANSGTWGAAFDAVADNPFAVTFASGFRQEAYAGGSSLRIKGVRTALLANNRLGTAKSVTISWWTRNYTFVQNAAVFDNSVGADSGGWLVGSSNVFASYTFCTKWGKFVGGSARPDGFDCLTNWRPWPMRGFGADDSWFHTAIDFDATASTSRLVINGVEVHKTDIPPGGSPLLLMLDDLVWDGSNQRSLMLDDLRVDERVFTTAELCSTIGGVPGGASCQLPAQPPRPWASEAPLPTRPGGTPTPAPLVQTTTSPPVVTTSSRVGVVSTATSTAAPSATSTAAPTVRPPTSNSPTTAPTIAPATTTPPNASTSTSVAAALSESETGTAPSDTPVILAATLGTLGGLILLSVVVAAVLVARKRRREQSAPPPPPVTRSPVEAERPPMRRKSSRRSSKRRVSSRRRSNRAISRQTLSAPMPPPEPRAPTSM